MDTLICSGQNITHFPDLKDSSWVSRIYILDTNITQIPSFSVSQWGNLYTIDIRDNNLLSCTKVTTFQRKRPDLLIFTDCDDEIINEDINTFSYGFFYLLLILIPLALLILCLIIYMKAFRGTNVSTLIGCM